uniref:ACP S-malonyltransferase n=1 Tax=Candidatus Fimenecus sp. TaxID=3022888 RepID=UPI003FF12D6E
HIAEECCALVSEETGEIVQPANYNCPGQIVISGEAGAVAAASELALARGVKRAVALPVSGPFHTEFMRPAGDALNEAFKRAAFEEMTFPVIFNVLGRKKKDEETISDLLIRQVSSPVLFEDSLKSMEAEAVDIMIEIGPGKALSTFAKKTCRGIDMCNIDTADDFEEVIRKLKETMREERP